MCISILQKKPAYRELWGKHIQVLLQHSPLSRSSLAHGRVVGQETDLFRSIEAVHVPSRFYSSLESLVNNVYFYNKDRAGFTGASVARVQKERKNMYTMSDTLNGLLGGF